MLKATEHIYYVGVQDPDLRVFDIIMESKYGTSYNAYLVKGREKTALIETVKDRFFDEYMAKVEELCDPAEIDYIVMNHTEPDHSGSLARLLARAPGAQVLASTPALNFLAEIVNGPVNGHAVGEGDTVDLGGLTLQFISAPQLHWPDTIYTYIPEEKALFTCDSFGCHYADERVFNDLIEGDFTEAYKYYFDNILGPFRRPYMANALKKIEGLDIAFIGNGHGPVLRTNIDKYIEMYKGWCAPAPAGQKKVAIAYVSSYGYTAALAKAIGEELAQAGLGVEAFDLVTDSKAGAAAAIDGADAFLLGSPTILGDALPPVWEMLLGVNPVIHKGKPAGAFGSYGWSGEAVPNLTARMEQLKLKTAPGLRVRFRPSDAQLEEARAWARDFAALVK